MDWKLGSTAWWTLIGSTLCLVGCMTPGFQLQEAPGFTSTIKAYENSRNQFEELSLSESMTGQRIDHARFDKSRTVDKTGAGEAVVPAGFECAELLPYVEPTESNSNVDSEPAIQHVR